MHRLFVAIRPPEPICDLLIDSMDDTPDFRWQDDQQLHLTIRFVGEVDRPVANDIADSLGQIRSPELMLAIAGVGRFEQATGGTLWAAVGPKAPLAALAKKIERVCQEVGLAPERRAFHPHITLARWRGRRSNEVRDFLDRRRDLRSDPFQVTEFLLFESRLSRHGAHYQEVASYKLNSSSLSSFGLTPRD